jgi:hypothetical protein
MSEDSKKHYIDINNDKIDKAFDILDDTMGVIFNEHKLNYFEAQTVLSMMSKKIERNNIDQYLLETVTRFQEKINEEDEDGR